MSDSSILITGASGFIGVALHAAIKQVQPNSRVFVAGRKAPSSPIRGAIHVQLDLEDRILKLPRGIDVVIHLAGEKKNESRMWAVNRDGTRNLIEASISSNVGRVIHLSSVGVYGARKNSGRVDESDTKLPRNTYEASKWAGQKIAEELCRENGIECVVAQPSNVIGYVKGSMSPLLGLMSRIKAGHFFFFGNKEHAWVNYVGLDDTISAILKIYQAGVDNKNYIINTPARLLDLVTWISDELQVSSPRMVFPETLGSILASSGDLLERVVGKTMPLNRARFVELTSNTHFSSDKLSDDTGFQYPYGIEKIVRQLVRSYQAEGVL